MKIGNTEKSYIVAAAVGAVALISLIIFGIALNPGTNLFSSSENGSGKIVSDGTFGTVVFNEMLLSNDKFYPDGNGEFFDYVEFRNMSGNTVDMSSWYIIEDGNTEPWYFPNGSLLEPNGYMLVFFCGEKRSGLYCSMKLSKRGRERFTLYSRSGVTIDRVITSETERNLVYARSDGGKWRANETPTPLFPNNEQGTALFEASRVRKNDPVKITEIMADNLFTLTDSDGDFSDYIEITNFGSEEKDLKGYTVSNDSSDRFKWVLPSVKLGAGESIVIFASGKDRVTDELHLSFRLASDCEYISLCDEKGVLIDEIEYTDLANGKVVSRSSRGSEPEILNTPSPRYTDIDEYSAKTDSEKELIINEVMVLNDRYAVQNGEYFDWIEIKNNSAKPILLSDYYLSCNKNNPQRWQFPSITLQPGEMTLVFASGSSEKSTSAFIHCDFRLSSEYEELYLYRAEGDSLILADGAVLTDIPYGMSYGRSPSKGGFVFIPNPTPGEENAEGLRYISSAPVPSLKGGIYNGVEGLSLDFRGNGNIYYTLDGSVPDENSPLFTGPISFSQTCVVRAVSYEEGKVPSECVTQSYIINESHTLPVVSVASDPYGLWSAEEGICNRGKADENGKYPKDANIWKDWERACSVELFDGIWGFSADCGIKLFGQSNREYPKQSFQLKFRAEYGCPAVYCSLFENTPEITRFKSLVLRSGSQDYRRSVFRDELSTSLACEMDLLVQGYKACVLYINGEYYGIYFIREKIDEHFIASHLGVSEESVDLLVGNGNVVYGSNDDWYGVLWYAKNYDLSKTSNYNYLKRSVDVESFADFIIAQAFYGNRDSGNIKYYRSSETDGKWRWILYDLDYAMTDDTDYGTYGLFYMIDPSGTGYAHRYSTTLINSLLRSPVFFDMFLRRFSFHLNNTFAPDRVISYVDSFKTLLGGEIERNIAKWGNSLNTWNGQTRVIKYFVTDNNDTGKTRKEVLVSEIKNLFSLTDTAVEYYFYMTDDQRAEFDAAVSLGLTENPEEIFAYSLSYAASPGKTEATDKPSSTDETEEKEWPSEADENEEKEWPSENEDVYETEEPSENNETEEIFSAA